MYIEATETYYVKKELRTKRARFLIVMALRGGDPSDLRGIVRRVAMRQCGRGMVGRVRVGRGSYSVSGDYGNEGLAVNVSADAFRLGIPLPLTLRNEWENGDWQGSEVPAMKEWARNV
jgi:hypothetical protein